MNRTLFAADCLDVLNDAAALPDASIDLIYLDPPFNSNSKYNLPFKGSDKGHKPVEAFVDIWKWSDQDAETLDDLNRDPRTRSLATIIKFAQDLEQMGGGRQSKSSSLASYLLNMALRLWAMRRVLKPTGSIYLHCDPTASHYLKLLMDSIFGRKNFRNEIVWCYRTGGASKNHFGRKHDIVFFWSMSKSNLFHVQKDRSYLTGAMGHRVSDEIFEDEHGKYQNIVFSKTDIKLYIDEYGRYYTMVNARDYWQIDAVGRTSKERLGYPTQKPLALLERIIKASSNEGDTVLDPFCGCGTTVQAAESLSRKWIGIDISKFSTGLIRDRILHNFQYLNADDIDMRGTPDSVAEARNLARANPFEFEKWVCGYIGAEGMFREPGQPGADGGVDGVLKFFPVREGKMVKPEYAIVQVKGGKVTADAVKALHETVRRYEATAGVMVCFGDQLGTVENQRVKATFSDAWGSYPVIQGFSVESLLNDSQLDLPLYGYKRRGAMLGL